MSQKQKDKQMVEKAIQELSEHFDSVHVFASRHESGEENGTVSIQQGCGNWFARYGQVLEGVTKQKEQSRIEARIQSGEI